MPRYYFNITDGRMSIDDDGQELSGLDDARKLAIEHSGEILKDGAGADLWAGKPWMMWVTDAPGGKGRTIFTLSFTATDGDGAS
jgi:hypothetical protein